MGLADSTPEKRRARVDHPKGYEPGVELTDKGGTGVVSFEPDETPDGVPDEAWLVERFGLDPDEWSIVEGSLNVRRWQRYDGLWLAYFKAQLDRRNPAERELIASILDRVTARPVPPRRKTKQDGAFCVLATDLQIGKAEGGGTDGFLYRFGDSVDAAVGRWLDLKDRGGWAINDVALLLGGDTCEGTTGQYAAQPFSIDLGQRDQLEIAALSIDYMVDRFVDAGASRITLAGVPSNHGENRSGKSLATSPRDSTDLVVLDQLRRAYSKSSRYDRVTVVVPDGEHTTITLDIAGEQIGLAHSHQSRKSTADWWKGQMPDPSRPLSRARVLFVGHRHHLHIQDVADDRYLIQGPSLDGGSSWFADIAGEDQSPGMLTCVVAGGQPHDIDLIRIPR